LYFNQRSDLSSNVAVKLLPLLPFIRNTPAFILGRAHTFPNITFRDCN